MLLSVYARTHHILINAFVVYKCTHTHTLEEKEQKYVKGCERLTI